MNAIRLCFSRSKLIRKVLNKSVSSRNKGPKGGKMYDCASCSISFFQKDVQVDHIDPVVPKGYTRRDMAVEMYLNRVFCVESNLQVLCKPCHQNKTNQG